MYPYIIRQRQWGFTLIELLIVVIILAVLAAIIIPQFTSATVDAKESALDADLTGLRSAIEIYHAQHNGAYPGAVATSGGSCSATAGSGAANSAQAFIDSLLMYSDANGDTCSLGDATTYRYGPYVRKGVPADPITGKGSAAADIAVTNNGAPIAPAAATGGWAYDTVSGQIVMNSNATDSKGNAYSTH